MVGTPLQVGHVMLLDGTRTRNDRNTQMCADFDLFLKEKNLTHAQVDEALRIVKVLPHEGESNVLTAPSNIHGTGVFIRHKSEAGARIGMAMINGTWTVIGRFTNHSQTPNSRVFGDAWNMSVIAGCPLAPGEEITVNYRDVGKALKL